MKKPLTVSIAVIWSLAYATVLIASFSPPLSSLLDERVESRQIFDVDVGLSDIDTGKGFLGDKLQFRMTEKAPKGYQRFICVPEMDRLEGSWELTETSLRHAETNQHSVGIELDTDGETLLINIAEPVYSREIRFATPAINPLEPTGTGTPADPFLVSGLENLYWMAINPDHWDKHYRQTSDIDASATSDWHEGAGWEPVGSVDHPFAGTYHGQGYKISGLTINRPDQDNTGMFGYVTGATIRQMTLLGATVSGATNVGILAGYLMDGSQVIECSVSGSVNGMQYVGGLAGYLLFSLLENSSAAAQVQCTQFGGGLVGVTIGEIRNSYSTGAVNGNRRLGGLVGGHANYILRNSYYNFEAVLINGQPAISLGAIDAEMFADWLANDRVLEVSNYLQRDGLYYLINNIEDFKRLLAFGQMDHHFLLTDDLDLDEVPGFYIPTFFGNLNGNGYTIHNATPGLLSEARSMGLFAEVRSARIENLGVVNVAVSGRAGYSGGLAGDMINSYLNGCYVTGVVHEGDYTTGGLAGGLSDNSHISASYANVALAGTLTRKGGLVGVMLHGSTIRNSYSMGAVSGQNNIGGLVGIAYGGKSVSRIERSYTTARVSGVGANTGGLVGAIDLAGVEATSIFWDTEATEQSTSPAGTGKTMAEMKNVATYTDLSTVGLDEPWDFAGNPYDDEGLANFWSIHPEINDGYPYPNWMNEDVYTVSLASNPPGHESLLQGAGVYAAGQVVVVTADELDGYRFVDWTEQGELLGSETELSFTVTVNKSLIANYQRKEYSITLMAEPQAGGGASGGGAYLHGEMVTARAMANLHFNFDRWTEDGQVVSTEAAYAFVASDDRLLTAHFDGTSYAITSDVSPADAGVVDGDGLYYYGEIVSMEATPGEGFHFLRWMQGEDQVSVLNPYLFGAAADRYLVAEFAVNWWDAKKQSERYLITAVADPVQVGVVLGQGYYDAGEEVTLIASPNVGIDFDVWLEDGVILRDGSDQPIGAVLTFVAAADRELVARFGGQKYTVEATATPPGYGDTEVTGDGTFFPGELAVVEAVATPGNAFDGWYEDRPDKAPLYVYAEAEYRFTVTGDRQLEALFSVLPRHVLTLNDIPLGSATLVQGGDGNYSKGEEVHIEALGRPGYSFRHWRDGAEVISSEPEYVFAIQRDRTLSAYFALNLYTITASAGTNGQIAPEGEVHVTHGEDQSFAMTPDAGYHLSSVHVDGMPVHFLNDGNWDMNSRAYTFREVAAAHTIEASFAEGYALYISSNMDGGRVRATPTGPYYEGDEVVLSAEPYPGYFFVNWTGNFVEKAPPAKGLASASNPVTIIIEGDTYVTANFDATHISLSWWAIYLTMVLMVGLVLAVLFIKNGKYIRFTGCRKQ